MPKHYIILILLAIGFSSCRLNPNGIYHIYKLVYGKHSDPQADDSLKQRYLNKPFLIRFSKGAVSISDPADPKPKILQRMNGKDGTVIYTPHGYYPVHSDTSAIRMELHTSSSDTILFINGKSFMSLKSVSTGKWGGMIICHLSKVKK